MRRVLTIAPVALLFAAGCLASKGDIEQLQTELRATRAQLAMGDSSILHADVARQSQIAQVSSKVDRAIDSLRVLGNRLAAFQATATGNFDEMNQQLVQMQALVGQNTRNLQETRSTLQALREQGSSAVSAPPPAAAATTAPADTSRAGTTAPAAGVPGPATLYESASNSINQGAYSTGRRALEQLLASYPTYELAPRAMLRIGETYKAEGNQAASDSVYRLVVDRYPKNSEAGLALYRIGKGLWDNGKKSEARIYLNRVIRDFPNSDAARLAKDTLNPRE